MCYGQFGSHACFGAEYFAVADGESGAVLFRTPAQRKFDAPTDLELASKWSVLLGTKTLPNATIGRLWRIQGTRVTTGNMLWVVGYYLQIGETTTSPPARYGYPGYAVIDVSDFENPVLVAQEVLARDAAFFEVDDPVHGDVGGIDGEWAEHPVFSEVHPQGTASVDQAEIDSDYAWRIGAGDDWIGRSCLVLRDPDDVADESVRIWEVLQAGDTSVTRQEEATDWLVGYPDYIPIAFARRSGRALGLKIVPTTGTGPGPTTVLNSVHFYLVSGTYDAAADEITAEHTLFDWTVTSDTPDNNDNLTFPGDLSFCLPVVNEYDTDADGTPYYVIGVTTCPTGWDAINGACPDTLNPFKPGTAWSTTWYYSAGILAATQQTLSPAANSDAEFIPCTRLDKPWKVWPIENEGVVTLHCEATYDVGDQAMSVGATQRISFRDPDGDVVWFIDLSEATLNRFMHNNYILSDDLPYVQCAYQWDEPIIYLQNCPIAIADSSTPLPAGWTFNPTSHPTNATDSWVTNPAGEFLMPLAEHAGLETTVQYRKHDTFNQDGAAAEFIAVNPRDSAGDYAGAFDVAPLQDCLTPTQDYLTTYE